MKKIFLNSVSMLLVMILLAGVVYPLAVGLIGTVFFSRQAQGSLIYKEGKLVGSELLQQNFVRENYFWGRPSASDFATTPSGASNLGPTSQKLKDRVAASMKRLGITEDAKDKPYELLLASGSGIDPHISPATAHYQIDRISRSRGLDRAAIEALIVKNTEDSTLGVFGRPRVNVLKLNLALDALAK
ncbi:MAG: potassium-transporting ATPase subunit KdpC [Bdellovibrionota bacterium]